MGLIDNALNTLSQANPLVEAMDSAGAVYGSKNIVLSGAGSANDLIANEGNGEFSVVDPQDWHKIYPFQFKIVHEDQAIFYTLPIPPDSISTKMHTASDATPTFGGVVEETSQNKLWSISLSGTTGAAISRGDDNDAIQPAAKFRNVISTTGLLSGLLGTVNKLAGFAGAAAAALNGNPADIAAGLASGFLQTTLPYGSSAVSKKSNGYGEINRLHRWFYLYSILAERAPDKTALYFVNYKESQQWRVVLKNFSVQKSAAEPYLYRYSIQLKGWDPKGVALTDGLEINRYAGDLKSVNTLTVTGAFSSLKTTCANLTIKKGAIGILPAVF